MEVDNSHLRILYINSPHALEPALMLEWIPTEAGMNFQSNFVWKLSKHSSEKGVTNNWV